MNISSVNMAEDRHSNFFTQCKDHAGLMVSDERGEEEEKKEEEEQEEEEQEEEKEKEKKKDSNYNNNKQLLASLVDVVDKGCSSE